MEDSNENKENILLSIDKSLSVAYKTNIICREYILGKVLGSGSFGTVRRAIHKATKQQRAIKILKKLGKDEEKFFLEVTILSRLSHPNIMHIYEFYEDKANFYIVSELCNGGELFDMISSKGCFSEDEACSIMRQLMSAICYCHLNGVVHRDLKPENILLDSKDPENITIKLIDWGGARYFTSQKMTKVNGTPYYIAPEVLNEIYDEKCDVWSAGIILYILLCGYPPFNGENDNEIMLTVKCGKFDFPEEEWSKVSDDAKNLIIKMLSYDSKDRPSAFEVLQHRWFKRFKGGDKKNINLIGNIPGSTISHTLENMNKFNKNYNHNIYNNKFNNKVISKFINKFQQATINFIVNQLISIDEKKELTELFSLLDKDGNGILDSGEILQGFRNASINVEMKEIENLIKRIELSENNFIDYNAFLCSTISKDKLLTDSNLEFVFNSFDKDGSGTISADEIMLVFKGEAFSFDRKIFVDMVKCIAGDTNDEIGFDDFKRCMEMFFN